MHNVNVNLVNFFCRICWHIYVNSSVARKFSTGRLCSSAWGLFVCAGGLDIINLTKTQLIYSVSRFNLGGLELCLGG